MPHPFLSAEWIAAASEIREKYKDDAPRIDIPIRDRKSTRLNSSH